MHYIAQQDPVMWAGVCWPKRNEADCMAVPNFRCLWNPYQCLPNPPVCDYMFHCMTWCVFCNFIFYDFMILAF